MRIAAASVACLVPLTFAACPSGTGPRPDGPGHHGVAGVPLLFAPLFERGAVARYAWTFSRPATADAPLLAYHATLECEAGEPRHFEHVTAIAWSCHDTSATAGPVAPNFDVVWMASPTQLWRLDVMPQTEMEASARIAFDPYLPGEPQPVANDVTTVSKQGIGSAVVWCRADLREGRTDELCFDPIRGVIERRVGRRVGESVEKLVLTSPPDSEGP